MTKMLVKAGSDVEATRSDGSTPLHMAASRSYTGIMTVLIEAGANPDSQLPRGETPLFLAGARGVDAIRVCSSGESQPAVAQERCVAG